MGKGIHIFPRVFFLRVFVVKLARGRVCLLAVRNVNKIMTLLFSLYSLLVGESVGDGQMTLSSGHYSSRETVVYDFTQCFLKLIYVQRSRQIC